MTSPAGSRDRPSRTNGVASRGPRESPSPNGSGTVPGPGKRPMPQVAGVRHSYHRAGELEMHVAEAGEGPPLVLLHGWPQHWYEWRKLIPALSEDYRVICPDLRGFGWSDAPEGGYDKETMARDVLALLDAMEVQRFYLAGHDWGGWVGFLMAQFAPERVERYVAMNIALPFARLGLRAVTNQWRFWYQLALATPGLGPRMVGRMAKKPGPIGYWSGATRLGVWTDEERETFVSQLAEPDRRRASVLLYRTFQLREMRWMMSGRYHRMGLEPPALVLHGREDRILRPVHLQFSKRIAPRLEVELVEDSGHFIVDERPGLVTARLLDFFAAGELRASTDAG
jgi:pimeloyl-ACP methyl ester carboxylesterase